MQDDDVALGRGEEGREDCIPRPVPCRFSGRRFYSIVLKKCMRAAVEGHVMLK